MTACLHRSGSAFAPLWAAECGACGQTLGRHRLISAAMRELNYHQRMHAVRADEAADGRAQKHKWGERRIAFYGLRSEGLNIEAAALRVGVGRGTASRWEATRRQVAA